MDEIKPVLEKVFSGWKGGEIPKKNIGDVDQKKSEVYIMDKPGSPQSVVFAGFVTLPQNNPDEIQIPGPLLFLLRRGLLAGHKQQAPRDSKNLPSEKEAGTLCGTSHR